MATPHAFVQAAVDAATAAGALIRAATADPGSLQVRQKHPNDFVTQVDTASEQAIVRRLLAAFPGHESTPAQQEAAFKFIKWVT